MLYVLLYFKSLKETLTNRQKWRINYGGTSKQIVAYLLYPYHKGSPISGPIIAMNQKAMSPTTLNAGEEWLDI